MERNRGRERPLRASGADRDAFLAAAQSLGDPLPLGDAEYDRDAGKRPQLLGRPLRVAARYHDLRGRGLAGEATDQLARFLIRPTRPRAGVDDDDVTRR